MSSETLNFCLLLSLSGIMLGVIIQMDKSGNKQQDYNYVYQALQSYVSSKYVGGPNNSGNFWVPPRIYVSKLY